MSTPRRVVYRALIGCYEQLREEEVAHDSAVEFICLTDDPTLTSSTWKVVVVEPRFALDHTRSSRALKILGHPVLDDYDETLWVDNTVALTKAPDALFDEWLEDADVAAPLHSYRASVLAEAEAVIAGGLDDFARVYEQLTHYLADGGEVLQGNPHWTGMLARRRTPATSRAMQTWWEEVLRYSRRDQLSFLRVMRAHEMALHSVSLDSHVSEWHEWPRATGRNRDRLASGLREALRPPAGRIGQLEEALDDATHTLNVTVEHRDEVIAGLERSLAESRQHAHETQVELDTVRHQRNLTAEELIETRKRLQRLRRRAARVDAQETARPSRWRRLAKGLKRLSLG